MQETGSQLDRQLQEMKALFTSKFEELKQQNKILFENAVNSFQCSHLAISTPKQADVESCNPEAELVVGADN